MITSYDPKKFIDREAELDFLLEIASSVFENQILSPSKRVVHLIGRSGIGKSWLTQKLCDVLSKDNSKSFYPIYVNLVEYTSLSANDFMAEVLKFIDKKVSKELKIDSPFPKTDYSVKDYSEWIFRCFEQIHQEKAVVLLFDEVSLLSSEQLNAIEYYLLASILHMPKVVLLLAGRRAVTGWKDFSLRPRRDSNAKELSSFNFENTQKQIKILNPQADDLAPRIHEISGGSPGNNKKILDQIISDPPQIVELDALRACNQEVYDALARAGQELPENIAAELLPALEALCVLQDFDKEYELPALLETHNGLNGVRDVKRSASLLNALSGIQVGPGKLVDWDKNKSAYAIEEQIRFSLEQELKIRNKDLWKILHCTAMKLYAQWARDYHSDIFGAKSDYHKIQLAEAGFDPDNC